MTKIVFTICSNNYLAQAKALGDSVIKNNPDYQFVICLCDKKAKEIDYSFFNPHKVIEAHELGIKKFEQMSIQYNIIELNTSIKPFAFSYLFKTFNAEYVMYFDPDTYVFDRLTSIEDELIDSSILLTPHIYTPIEFDGKEPTENAFTQHGIYNLGFLALKKSSDSDDLLEWWERRLEMNCYHKAELGIFVDQLPMNFSPIFFNNVKISKNWGLNMAPWNLHERTLSLKEDKYIVNNKHPLILYHFSNCYINEPEVLSTYYTRVTFDNNPVLKKLYDEYKDIVYKNNYNQLSKIECVYSKKTETKINNNKPKSGTLWEVIKYIKKYPLFFLRKDFWN